MEQKNTNSTLLLVIGIIAILALILSWAAFNRTGQDLEAMIAEQVEEAYDATAQTTREGMQAVEEGVDETAEDAALLAARAEARAELLAIQARIEAGETIDDVQADLNAVEANLEQAYEDAGQVASREWDDIQQGLQNTETALRNGTANTLEFIGGTILLLEEEVRYDEE